MGWSLDDLSSAGAAVDWFHGEICAHGSDMGAWENGPSHFSRTASGALWIGDGNKGQARLVWGWGCGRKCSEKDVDRVEGMPGVP